MDNQKESPGEEKKVNISRYSLLLSILIIIMIFVFFSLQNQRVVNSKTNAPNKATDLRTNSFVNVSYESLLFIVVKAGTAGRNDLFLCDLSNRLSCKNLTNSPSLSEISPKLSVSKQFIVYYGLNDSGADLYLLELSRGVGRPLTIQSGESKLNTEFIINTNKAPEVSPDGLWVAFPAKSREKNSVELFVARTDGMLIIQATKLGDKIVDYLWLNDTTLLVENLCKNGEKQYLRSFLDSKSFYIEILQIDNQ